ncbi:MAG: peptidase domain-containing ABC transporter, partial [Betaproteobacteria bacterium]
MPSMQVKGESLIWALSALSQLNRTPFDPKLILQQFAPPYTCETLHTAASGLGLKVGFKQIDTGDLTQLSLPCLGVVKLPARVPANDPKVTSIAAARGEPEPVESGELHGVVLIVQADAHTIAYFDGTNPNVSTLSVQAFALQFTGQVLLFVGQPAAAANDSGEPQQARAFGFTWFIPELLKHKHIWRDVLAASLVIQLMALATPVFTQIIIDKVVVH